MRGLFSAGCLLMVVVAVPALFGVTTSSTGLPDAPVAQNVPVKSQAAAGTSSLVGTVEDMHGAPIAGVVVTAAKDHETQGQTVTVDGQGAFKITGLAPGDYNVVITLPGRPASNATEVVLGAGEDRVLPIVTSRTPRTTGASGANLNQVATAQVKEAEKQRVLGVVPNFYTAYIWDSAPLTPKLNSSWRCERKSIRWSLSWTQEWPGGAMAQHLSGLRRRLVGLRDAIWIGVCGFRGGSDGGAGAIADCAAPGPAIFFPRHRDNCSRVLYALAQTVVTRGDNGKTQPNYSHVLGNFVTAGVSNVYREPSDRSAGLTFRDAGIVTAGDAVGNLLREFVSRPLTTNVPRFATGKQH